jgi:carbamoyltransferase
MIYTCNVKNNDLPSITHVDGTCRVQTVTEENGSFQKLLQEFFDMTGCPVLLNTSLNLAGYPLAAYPDNAKDLFYNTPIDCVFIGDEFLCKSSITGVQKIF